MRPLYERFFQNFSKNHFLRERNSKSETNYNSFSSHSEEINQEISTLIIRFEQQIGQQNSTIQKFVTKSELKNCFKSARDWYSYAVNYPDGDWAKKSWCSLTTSMDSVPS